MRTSSRSRSRLAALLAGVVGLLVAQVGLLATPAAALSTVGELRDAIDDANAANVDTVIELDAGSTFLVTGADCGVPGEDGNASGDFDITNTATTTFATVGTGAPAVVEMDCPSERVFENTLHGTVVFDTVVITGGDLNPYIAMESPAGGGVWSNGDVSVIDSTIVGNLAADGAGGTVAVGPGADGDDGIGGGNGGGIFLGPGTSLTVTDSTISDNHAGDGGNGAEGICGDAGSDGSPGSDGTTTAAADGADAFGGNADPGANGVNAGGFFGSNAIFPATNTGGNGGQGAGGNGGDAIPDEVAGGAGGQGLGGFGGTGSQGTLGGLGGGGGLGGPGGDGGGGGQGGNGGGINSAGQVDITASTIVGNTAGDGGDGGDGGCGGDGGAGGDGGGGGDAGRGGGVHSTGDLTIVNSTLTANASGAAGGGGDGGAGGDGGSGGVGGQAGDAIGGTGGAGIGRAGGIDANGVAAGDGGDGIGGAGGIGGSADSPGAGGDAGDGGDGGDGGGTGKSSQGGNINSESGTLELINDTITAGMVGSSGTPGSGGALGSAGLVGPGGEPGSYIGGSAGTGIAGQAGGDGGSDGTGTPGSIGPDGTPPAAGSAGAAGTDGVAGTGGGAPDPGTGGNVAAGISDTFVDGTVIALAASGGDCSGVDATAESYNADSDDTCNFDDPTDRPGLTAGQLALGPLADNGGPTETQLPDTTSELVNAIPDADCFETVDQRGVTRPQGGGCEIGSVELAVEVEVDVEKVADAGQVQAGESVEFQISVTNVGSGVTAVDGVAVSDPLCDGEPQLTGGDVNDNDRLDPAETWTYECVWTTSDADIGVVTNVVTVTITDQLGNTTEHTADVDVEVLGSGAAATPISPATPIGAAQGGLVDTLAVTGIAVAGLVLLALALVGAGVLFVRAGGRRAVPEA
jgi:hypothetical protein